MTQIYDGKDTVEVDLMDKSAGVEKGLQLWFEATQKGVSFQQHVNSVFGQHLSTEEAARFGTPFQQMLRAEGIRMQYNPVTGERPPRMSAIMGSGVVRPDGSQALTAAGRLLFPATILQWIESELMQNTEGYTGAFNSLVAYTSASDSVLVQQPVINFAAARDSLPQSVAQGAEAPMMMTISLSNRTFNIPTRGIALEVTDDAQKALQIDYIGMSLQEQIRGMEVANVNEALSGLVNGDTDRGISALPGENLSAYDSAVVAPSSSTPGLTNKAWVKWLRRAWWKMQITDVFLNEDTVFPIQDRIGRPTVFTDPANDMRLTAQGYVTSPLRGIADTVNLFIVPDGVGIGANTLVGIDRTKAIHKIVVASATYSAVEAYVLRRTTGMRFDSAVFYTRMIPGNGLVGDNGWKKAVIA